MTAQTSGEVAALQQRAEAGDAEAQNALGNLYSNGRGVPADPATALKWYRQAAEKGFAAAHFNLGLAYESGRGVPVDERQAFRHYLLAAERGFPAAQFNVGNMYAQGRGVGQDAFEANIWFRQAAENGIAEAQFNLGLAYELGRGVRKNEDQAVHWYSLAADRGFARAQYNLGLMREEGRGGAKDIAAAANLYRAAAVQGFGPAQNNLGVLLAEGAAGVSADPVQGYAWLLLAVESGVSGQAREVVASKLSAGQQAEAARLVAEFKSERTTISPSGSSVPAAAPVTVATTDASYVEGLEALVNRLRAANEELGAANERLTIEKTQLQQRSGGDADTTRLVEELRAQGGRLAAANQQLATDKELAEREKTALSAQVRDLEAEIGRLRRSTNAPATVDASAALREQIRSLEVEKSAAEQALAEAQAEVVRLSQVATTKSSSPVDGAQERDARMRNLERDNERLNDEVKRATRELLSLNSQLRQAREPGPAAARAPDTAAQEENSRLARVAAENEQRVRQLEAELAAAKQRIAAIEPAERPDPSWTKQLAETNAALAKSEASVAELTGENDRLERELAAARRTAQEASGSADELRRWRIAAGESESLRKEVERLRASANEVVGLRDEVGRLQAAGREASALREQLEQVQRENDRLKSAAGDGRAERELTIARGEIAALENRLREALSRPAPADDRAARELVTARNEIAALEGRLREALSARADTSAAEAVIAKLETQVAELTGENDRLERDLETARKATDAALAAQQQAVTAARPDAYQMEIRTLQERVKQLEATLEDERGNAARELSAVAAQLQRTREANRALTEANRSLLAAAESADQPTREELDEALGRIRDLTAAGDEMRRQIDALAQGRAAAEAQAEASATELAAVQARLAASDKAAESHGSAVAELTGENQRLMEARDALQRQVETMRVEIAQLQQTTQSAEQQRIEAERSASLNVNAMAAQLAELRGDLEAVRAQNARLIESNTALERERSTVTARLRSENAALAARLTQAQSTLDQIASAARLGTPAAQIAAGGAVAPTVTPSAATAEARYHTVLDGDSLSRISLRYYGTAARWQEIFEANREELRGANTLRVGQRLRIP